MDQPAYLRLFLIYLQEKLFFDKATDAYQHSFRRPLAFTQNQKIVSVSDEVQASSIRLLIQLVKQDIR